MTTERPLILVTNDDGIDSPGLLAAVAAVDPLGEVLICAPREQQTAMGHSFPSYNDGQLFERTLTHNGQSWNAYAVNGSPAQTVQHAVIELADRTPDLLVAGINYGENVGTGITGSGTVGAAIEGVSHGIPALAVSLELAQEYHYSHDDNVDFEAAIHFTRLFAARWLTADRPAEVDILKIDIPTEATVESEWRVTRLDRVRYFTPLPPLRRQPDQPGRLGYVINRAAGQDERSDVAALRAGMVSVTPLSLDLTAPVAPETLKALLNGDQG